MVGYKMNDGISFLVPTYGRFPHKGNLLHEVVYWFTKINYPKSKIELIILNDAPQQILKCDVDNVHVINFPVRFKTLGDKRNFLISLANYDVCLPWDDDDISLPDRAVVAYESIKRYDVDYWDPGGRWYEERGVLIHDHAQNCTHHASAYNKSVGEIYSSMNNGEDQQFIKTIIERKIKYKKDNLISPPSWSYIYRWGVSDFHTSVKNEDEIQSKHVEPGTFLIEPKMFRDYEKETHDICQSLKGRVKPQPYNT